MKCVLFSGPKGCGKSFAVEHLEKVVACNSNVEFKSHLRTLVLTMFNISGDFFDSLYNNRETKDEPNELLKVYVTSEDEINWFTKTDYLLRVVPSCYPNKDMAYLSPREAFIWVSEMVCKPMFGEDYFGVVVAEILDENFPDCNVNLESSCGFPEEIKPLIEKFGQDNILLIDVYADMCNFDNDSRNYIPEGIVTNRHSVYNNMTDDFTNQVEKIVEEWLNGE